MQGESGIYYKFFKYLDCTSSVQLAYAAPYSASEIPIQELFRQYFDGVRGVRGYNDQEVLPVDEFGNWHAGTFALIINALEIKFKIYNWIGGVLFVDGGKFWDTLNSFNINEIAWSYGPGISIALPIGLFWLDYGIKVDDTIKPEGRIHFYMGLPF